MVLYRQPQKGRNRADKTKNPLWAYDQLILTNIQRLPNETTQKSNNKETFQHTHSRTDANKENKDNCEDKFKHKLQ